MARKSPRTEKVTFRATKKVSRPVRVSFSTRTGKRVHFTATRKESVPVKVTFYRRVRSKK